MKKIALGISIILGSLLLAGTALALTPKLKKPVVQPSQTSQFSQLTSIINLLKELVSLGHAQPAPVLGNVNDSLPTFSSSTYYATSSATNLPVLLAPYDYGRVTGLIANASTNTVFIYFTNTFASNIAATTTVLANKGTPLTAGSILKLDANFITPLQIWVASTTVPSAVTFMEGN